AAGEGRLRGDLMRPHRVHHRHTGARRRIEQYLGLALVGEAVFPPVVTPGPAGVVRSTAAQAGQQNSNHRRADRPGGNDGISAAASQATPVLRVPEHVWTPLLCETAGRTRRTAPYRRATR